MSRQLLKITERATLDKILINGAIEKGQVYSADVLNMLFNSKIKYGCDSFFEHFYRRTTECIKAQTKDSAKRVCKYIPYLVTYFGIVTEERKGVLLEELEGLFYLKDKITALLDKFGLENNISNFLETARKVIEENYPEQFERITTLANANIEQETSEGSKESQRTHEIEEENARLTIENKELKTANQRLQQELDKKDKSIATIKARKQALEAEEKKRKTASRDRQKKISDNNEKIRQLRIALKESEAKNLSLQVEIDQKDIDHVEETRQLREIEALYNKDKAEAELKETIKERIIELLVMNEYSVMTIMHALSILGYDVSKELVLTCLNELEATFTLKKNTTNYPTTYKLTKAEITCDKKFKINSPSEGTIESLLISDIHACLAEIEKAERGLDIAYNYAVKKKIRLLTNLGDLFELNYPLSRSMNYDEINDLRRLIEEVSKRIPHDKGINHAILGGNHCEKIAECGINPIEVLEKFREDIIDLGYTRAYLSFGRPGSSQRDKIGLLHPNCKKVVTDENARDSKFSKELDPKEYARKDCYLTLMGHTHIGKYYKENGLYLIPSLTRDRVQNGAVHMKVNFDFKGNITSVELIPLVINNNRLEQVEDEIHFVRKRK